jgi:hypothetical protein
MQTIHAETVCTPEDNAAFPSCLLISQVMKTHGCYQLVFSSSCTVYGNPDVLPITEEHPTGNVTNVYGRTKYFIEEMLKDISAAEKVKITSAIPTHSVTQLRAHSKCNIILFHVGSSVLCSIFIGISSIQTKNWMAFYTHSTDWDLLRHPTKLVLLMHSPGILACSQTLLRWSTE